MTSAQALDNRLVLSDGSIDPLSGKTAGYINSAAPVMIGLIAPVLLFVLIDPLAIWYAPFLVPTVLLPLAAFSVAVYAYCVFNPGDVAAVVVDPAARTLELVQANFFATRRTEIAFSEIAGLTLAADYDQDGYAIDRAHLLLENGERVPLHAITDKSEYQALRAAIGLR